MPSLCYWPNPGFAYAKQTPFQLSLSGSLQLENLKSRGLVLFLLDSTELAAAIHTMEPKFPQETTSTLGLFSTPFGARTKAELMGGSFSPAYEEV